jgi:predicted nucleic acid-binding protein
MRGCPPLDPGTRLPRQMSSAKSSIVLPGHFRRQLGRASSKNSSVSAMKPCVSERLLRSPVARKTSGRSSTSPQYRPAKNRASTSTRSAASGTTTSNPWPETPLLADTSAWSRAHLPVVAEHWVRALRSGRIVTCSPVVLEVLYSATDEVDYDRLESGLDRLRLLQLTESAFRAARAAMRQLAARGGSKHRVPPTDYLIAALAEQAGVGVLHYDHDFDRLASVMAFESVWFAPPGSVP